MLPIDAPKKRDSKRRKIARLAVLTGLAAVFVLSHPILAQTRGVRDTATAYGARLNGKGEPASLNKNRLNNRLESRIENRLSLRIERYRIDNIKDPTAAFEVATDDRSRLVPTDIAPMPRSGAKGN